MDFRKSITQHIYDTYGTSAEYPWASSPENGIFRHRHNRKWYAALLRVSGNKVGLESEEPVDVINLKCEPDMVYTLSVQPGFAPAYHMNKKHWLTVRLDGSVPEEMIHRLIGISYELTGGR